MEFGEKLQELRKSRGLTQEELSEVLFVSRTAVSKWESGRGYPSIDSLKEISKFFSVSIDALLSGEKLLSIAERENRSNIKTLCDLLFGMTDILSLLLVLLPLYPKMLDGYVYSVSLIAYNAGRLKLAVYWSMIVVLAIMGVLQAAFSVKKGAKLRKQLMGASVILGIASVIIFALAGETYAVILSFLLVLVKIAFTFKSHQNGLQ